MRAVVVHPDGRIEEFSFTGENFTLGLAAAKHTCVCGTAEFVDGGSPLPHTMREPDRICSCGRRFWYYEDADEHMGHLH